MKMKIYVRNSDGLVLNNHEFNNSMPSVGIDNDAMFSAEDYSIYQVDKPNDPEIDWLHKCYYYNNGLLRVEYVPEIYLINSEINRLKDELSKTDYVVQKISEYSLVGLTTGYNIEEVHASRQAVRNKINELESYLTVK